ncbi:MAG: BrnT family toxin [Cyanobacteria bacterium P01_A01_bin.123]
MEFEFDDQKSQSNKVKHGIDFIGAQALWENEDRLEVPARTSDEPRSVILGQITSKIWAAVVTYRGENIRIISVRRARKREVEFYESSRF